MGASVLVRLRYLVGDGNIVLIGLCSLLALAASSWIIRSRWLREDVLYPPGPRGLPIVGHLHMVGSLPNRTFTHLSKSYGPLFSLRFGSIPVIVASSPAMASLMLHTHDKILSGRPLNFSVARNTFGAAEILLSHPGPFWKLMRKLFVTELGSVKRLDYFKPLRAQEVRSLMLSIFAAQGVPVTIREMLLAATTNMISRILVSKSLEEIAVEIPNSEKIAAAIVESLDLVASFNVGDYFPWLAWMDVQGYGRRTKKVARITTSVFQALIDRRRSINRSSDEPARDYLDVMLKASLNSKNTDAEFDDANIRAVILDMFGGGIDTTSATIEWALTELLINPKIMKTLQEELEQIVGCSRLVQETDLPNLPYLRAVVNEAMRLHPVSPLLAPHMAMEASQIFGYQIPKNTLVYINVWAIHRDPSIWDNPLEFSPERFLDRDTDELTQQCRFLPFGVGRRACPGARLGLLSVQHVLANLVHAFEWRTLAKPNLKEKFGLVTALVEPLVTVPLPKLPKALLETLT